MDDDEPMKPSWPEEPLAVDDDDPAPVKKKGKRRSTTHLKAVPETLELREKIKFAAEEYAKGLDKVARLLGMSWNSMDGNCWIRWNCPRSFWASRW